MIEKMVAKFDKMNYIYFNFVFVDGYYKCNVYVSETPQDSGKVVMNYNKEDLFAEGLSKNTIEEAFDSSLKLLNNLYEEYRDYKVSNRLSDDIDFLKNYTVSPYYAAVMSEEQYLSLIDKYQKEIKVIVDFTQKYNETGDNNIISERLSYAKNVIDTNDVSNVFYYRSFSKVTEQYNLLIAIATQDPFYLETLIEESVQKFNEINVDTVYVNQWVVRAYETATNFPLNLFVDEEERLFVSNFRRPNLKSISRKDLNTIVLDMNVNREI